MLIPCPRSMKARFLRQLGDEVFLYCEDHGQTDALALSRRFGTPDAVAKEFLETLDPAALRQNRQRRAHMILASAVAGAVLLTAVGLRMRQALRETEYLELIPSQDVVAVGEGPAYWVKTNDGGDIRYWEYDYDQNQWISVTVPSEH